MLGLMLSGPIALFIRSLGCFYLTWLDVMKGLEGEGVVKMSSDKGQNVLEGDVSHEVVSGGR